MALTQRLDLRQSQALVMTPQLQQAIKLLQLSRLGRRELQCEPIATEALVHETLRTLAHQIAQRQVQVTVGPLPVVASAMFASRKRRLPRCGPLARNRRGHQSRRPARRRGLPGGGPSLIYPSIGPRR